MRALAKLALVAAFSTGTAGPVLAQRLSFERSFEVNGAPVLDVSTVRGQIDVTAGEPGRIVIVGAVTVRVAWDVPADAPDLARNIADHPPMEQHGQTIRLRPPSDAVERRAVTVSYQVRVPPNTEVLAVSESGATTVRGVSGPVVVRTQSGAIELSQLGGTSVVTTGSGAVTVAGADGALTVTTSSSAFSGRALHGSVRVRTTSGHVDATLSGPGDVDIETGSSAIRVRGVRGALTASTQSGRVSVQGTPGGAWNASTGSGSVDMSVGGRSFTLDATSRSGSVRVEGAAVQGVVSKRKLAGTVGSGGPLVRITSGSGSIHIAVAEADQEPFGRHPR